VANNKEAARRRRALKAEGGLRIGSVTIADPETWTEILKDQDLLPLWQEGKTLTPDQMQIATQKLIEDWCREVRREKAEAVLSKCPKIVTGLIQREPPPVYPAAAFSTRFSEGGHWSFKPGQKKDKGRVLTDEERAQWVKDHPDVLEDQNSGLDGLCDIEQRAIIADDEPEPVDEFENGYGEDGHF
jgi:hypothetical protein